MKNQELFNKTISILVKAYHAGRLQNQNCYACAVGNIIADNCGFEYEKDSEGLWVWVGKRVMWQNAFVTIRGYGQDIDLSNYVGEVKRQLDSTGYKVMELAKIENAFEEGSDSDGDFLFNGLMSVVDTLMLIHEANEIEVKQAKQLFVLS